MRAAGLVLITLLLAAAGLAFVLRAAVPMVQEVAGPQPYVHIETTADAAAEPAAVALPLGAVGALLAMAPGAIAENGQIRLGEGQHLPVDALRGLWAQVQSADGPVTVEHEDAVIRVEQTGERVAVRFERNGEATLAELPAAVLDAALSASDGGLDIPAAVAALAERPGEEILVTGDGRRMRVWIDTAAGQ